MNDKATGTEGWHKVKLDGRSDYKINDGRENLVAMFVREHAADEIIAAHNASDPTALDVTDSLRWLYEASDRVYTESKWWQRRLFWPWFKRPDWRVVTNFEVALANAEEVLELTAIASKHPGSEQKGG